LKRRHLTLNHILFQVTVILTVLVILLPKPIVYARNLSQDDPTRERAQALLDTLTPEERVGQLFLVTFNGTIINQDTQIYDLINNHHVGGVVLLAGNDNFLPPTQTPTGVWQLSRALQTAEWSASQANQLDPGTSQEFTPAFIPMLIGISQEGNSASYDQIFNGLTSLPSQMAIGATWQPELAHQAGVVAGGELSALGVNFLLGPSLDVLDSPREQGEGDLGVRSFGGDPFWVGEMGQAYITGVHEGSSGRIALISKHFPGYGSSDRLPEDEVATVRKSLEQLRQIELPPFYAVTGDAPTEAATTDGLLVSHIRYQGFQGNIRETTRPVSLDRTALDQLMSIPQFANWRDAGGILTSDNLGSPALRRFADPSGNNFSARFIARDAFLAGNDLLYLGNEFIATGDPDTYTTTIRTLAFFAQKYREDPAFQQQVDESALRILMLKYQIYGNVFTLSQVVPTRDASENLGTASQVTFEIAQQSATLISPSVADLAETLPEPPNLNDRIVFISQEFVAQQCSTCPIQEIFAKDSLENAVVRLYGPSAGGQVLQRNLVSYSYEELQALLDQNQAYDLETIESDLSQSQWIVFSMMNVKISQPSSQTLSRFLGERPDLYRQKSFVVFAFDAPYYLDATEISKLSAYYALYSKVPQFVEVAARLLFDELPSPPGSLPVSVTGVDYDLISATAPDPDQTIQLLLDLPESNTNDGTVTPAPTSPPLYEIGDLIPVRTGVIVDHNGHPVPDNTPVQFVMSIGAQEITSQIEITEAGIARTTFLVEQSGTMEIRAQSDRALNSTVLQIDIPPEAGSITGLPPQTLTSEPPTQTLEPTLTQTLQVTSVPPDSGPTSLGDWVLSVFLSITFAVAIYWFTTLFGVIRWGLRAGLLGLIGGLIAYTYLSIDLPGSSQLLSNLNSWAIVVGTIIGSAIGWGVALSWQKLAESKKSKPLPENSDN
jgi:beta-N-acetylhexosaminidase